MKDDRLDNAQRIDWLRRIEDNATQLEKLLLSLFDLDRISRGILEPQRHLTDMRELVASIKSNVDFHGRSVTMDLEECWASVDPAMIQRVVENLLVNSYRHTPPDAHVFISLTKDGDGVLLCVEDNGPGVPETMWREIFEAFRQADFPAHSPGTGIGLALVSKFVELHHGQAWVEDRPGGGASFRVWLPKSAPRQRASSDPDVLTAS